MWEGEAWRVGGRGKGCSQQKGGSKSGGGWRASSHPWWRGVGEERHYSPQEAPARGGARGWAAAGWRRVSRVPRVGTKGVALGAREAPRPAGSIQVEVAVGPTALACAASRARGAGGGHCPQARWPSCGALGVIGTLDQNGCGTPRLGS